MACADLTSSLAPNVFVCPCNDLGNMASVGRGQPRARRLLQHPAVPQPKVMDHRRTVGVGRDIYRRYAVEGSGSEDDHSFVDGRSRCFGIHKDATGASGDGPRLVLT